MAVTANQVVRAQGAGQRRKIPVGASVRIYEGTIVYLERTSGSTEGYASAISDSGTNDFAGIAVKEANNTDGSAGDIDVEVWTVGGFVLNGAAGAFSQGNVGDLAYCSDNAVITASSSSTTKMGAFSEYFSATKMRVDIDAIQT